MEYEDRYAHDQSPEIQGNRRGKVPEDPRRAAEFFFNAAEDEYHLKVRRWVRSEDGERVLEEAGYIAVNGQGEWSQQGIVRFMVHKVDLDVISMAGEAWKVEGRPRVWYWRLPDLKAYKRVHLSEGQERRYRDPAALPPGARLSFAIPLPERVLTRLSGVKTFKGGWTANCPAHPDKKGSLSINIGRAGGVGLRCLSGCEQKKILQRMGLPIDALQHDPIPTCLPA